ncbi:MAG: BrnT family toxin [Limnospira sp. PMC 1240.20]|nr:MULTISPECIES: BrnT family toxin [unclassified Limnospira]MBD2574603.1 BrnT family toxin [Arthrospira platensis FACHB-971]MDT9220772.1 BrnT family toxin [Limnospira sp. PMC 1240.20]MDT9248693.1 BrnT family toxin [Limnospira sp. PMC 1280.21]MDT9268975.1 BrnT family toxin [Limnospira sp. PMC 1234.20]MDT9300800.1 BrnT family toxin [Limnospira sp. PMC 1281.21]MDY7053509.1 BrnT family toxin [Limnospira fusiformis LS22]QJB29477.1 BrnT family toxin [Limnospira fusiformis SAG 85.79]QNH60287.1 MAG
MEFEWDETKRLTNLRKHGINFIDVPLVFDGDIVTFEDDRFNYGEQRFVTLGLLQGRVVAIVHTEQEKCIRIISARKATKYEQQIYFEQLSN